MLQKKMKTIGILGGGNDITSDVRDQAYEVGKLIALKNIGLVCGGLGGVMEAACKGAFENGGIVIGILPGESKNEANDFIHIIIPTGMSICRNVLVVRASDVCIAFPGSFGTLTEIALAMALQKPIICMPGTWNIAKMAPLDTNYLKEAVTATHALGLALPYL